MFVATDKFIAGFTKVYDKHSVSTDGGTWYLPQACRFLRIKHHLLSPFEKSIIERTMQYIKDRIEGCGDYFPCRKRKCNFCHIKNWLKLVVNNHNKEMVNA